MAEEERYILLEAAQKLGISKGTLVNWIARAGWRELVDKQALEYDQRAHYLTGEQLEKLAKDHRRQLKEEPKAVLIPVPTSQPDALTTESLFNFYMGRIDKIADELEKLGYQVRNQINEVIAQLAMEGKVAMSHVELSDLLTEVRNTLHATDRLSFELRGLAREPAAAVQMQKKLKEQPLV